MRKFALIIITTAFLFSCAKNSDSRQEEIKLQSSNGSIKLGSSVNDLVSTVKKSIGIKDAITITKVEYPECSRGAYAIVSYTHENGVKSNIVYSTFAMNSISSSTIIHTTGAKNPEANFTVPSCYEYWCTTYGNCTTCSVSITDPYGTPILSCSCSECHLHQKKYDCPQ